MLTYHKTARYNPYTIYPLLRNFLLMSSMATTGYSTRRDVKRCVVGLYAGFHLLSKHLNQHSSQLVERERQNTLKKLKFYTKLENTGKFEGKIIVSLHKRLERDDVIE